MYFMIFTLSSEDMVNKEERDVWIKEKPYALLVNDLDSIFQC